MQSTSLLTELLLLLSLFFWLAFLLAFSPSLHRTWFSYDWEEQESSVGHLTPRGQGCAHLVPTVSPRLISLCSGTEDCFLKSQKSILSLFKEQLFLESKIRCKYERCLLSYQLWSSSRQFHMLPKARRQVSLKCNADKLPTAI